MNNLKTLYSRDSNGGVRVWWVSTQDNAYCQNYGVLDGKIVTTGLTYCEGKNIGKKNETSPVKQLEKEVESLYKKQLKTGYFEKVEDIDNFVYVEPMLAKNFLDRLKKVTYPCIVQCKYNGGRCIVTKDGMFSRTGEKTESAPHIRKSLDSFFEKYPDAVLDGELLGNGMKQKLNETMKLTRKTVHISQEDLDRSEQLVRYWVYDCYGFEGITEDNFYKDRQAAISKGLSGNPYYMEVPSYVCKNEADVFEIYEKFVADNEEGAIIRLLDFPYEHGRSAGLLKLKPVDSDEAIIVDITEGTGDWAGTGKRITLNWKDKIFDATFKGTYEQGVQFLRDKDQWIGKEVTFLFNSLTGLGVPNYARVDIDNCDPRK